MVICIFLNIAQRINLDYITDNNMTEISIDPSHFSSLFLGMDKNYI